MQTFEQFLAGTAPEAIHELTALTTQQRISTNDAADAAAIAARLAALFDAQLLWKVSLSREWRDGQVWHVFDGIVESVAAGYCAWLARKRVELSRLPIAPSV